MKKEELEKLKGLPIQEMVDFIKEFSQEMCLNMSNGLKGNKAAMKRARKQTIELAELSKAYRKLSILASEATKKRKKVQGAAEATAATEATA